MSGMSFHAIYGVFSPITDLKQCAQRYMHATVPVLPSYLCTSGCFFLSVTSLSFFPTQQSKGEDEKQDEGWELQTNPHVVLLAADSWTKYPARAHIQLVLLAKHILCSLNSFFTRFIGQITQHLIYCSWKNEWTTDLQEMKMLILNTAQTNAFL